MEYWTGDDSARNANSSGSGGYGAADLAQEF
jgi:hypothetical protein